VTPLFTVAGLAEAVGNIMVGAATISNGEFYAKVCVENCTAQEEADIRAYFHSRLS
jgi:hypothetical protein